MEEYTENDEFVVDDDGYIVVPDPQHGHSFRMRKATETEKEVYEQKLQRRIEERRAKESNDSPPGARHDWF